MIKLLDGKHPALLALHAGEEKLQALVAERVDKEAQRDRETERYLTARRMNQGERLDAEVDAMLEIAPAQQLPNAQSIEELEHDIKVLTVAIERQTGIVDALRGKYSVALCELNRGGYIAIAKKLSSGIQEVAEANETEIRFFEELKDAGCWSIIFRAMRVYAIGVESDPSSLAARHRRELQTYVPEAL